jgi:hypothetical protein
MSFPLPAELQIIQTKSMAACIVCNTGGQFIRPCNCQTPIHKHCFVATRVGKTGCLTCKRPYKHILTWAGDVATFDERGFLYVYCLNSQNQLHGICMVYYPNTMLEFQGVYKNGVRCGDYTRFYEDGNVMEKQRGGAYVMYNEDGSVLTERKI